MCSKVGMGWGGGSQRKPKSFSLKVFVYVRIILRTYFM